MAKFPPLYNGPTHGVPMNRASNEVKYDVQLKGGEWYPHTRHDTLEGARKHRQATIDMGRWPGSVRIQKVTITSSESFELVPDPPVMTSAKVVVYYSDGSTVEYPVKSVSVQHDPLWSGEPVSPTTVVPPKLGKAVIRYE